MVTWCARISPLGSWTLSAGPDASIRPTRSRPNWSADMRAGNRDRHATRPASSGASAAWPAPRWTAPLSTDQLQLRMKITRIRPWHVSGPPADPAESSPKLSYVFVQVETDAGLTGWGEITTYPGTVANRSIVAALCEVDQFLRGQDATQIEATWHKLLRAFTYMGTRGATTAMVSAIDIALWDIKGQALGVPIYELLGGAVRDAIPLYTHFQYTPTVEHMRENARAEVERGSRAIKTDPFMAAGGLSNVRYIDGQIDRTVENTGIAMIAAIRDAVGPDIEVLIDAHALYNVPTAVRLATRLAPYAITWFEEPCPPESYDALEQVRSQIPVPFSVGERLYTRFEFLPVLTRHLRSEEH